MLYTAILFITMLNNADCNIAVRKPTYSSSFYSDGYKPSNAVNGDHNVDVYAGYCFSTNYDDMTPWLLIDLMSSYVIDNVTLTLRTDSIAARAHDYQLEVFEMNPVHCTSAVGQLCFKHDGQLGSSKTLTCDQEVKGRFLKLSKYVVNNREDTLDLCELDVAGTEANVQDNADCNIAVRKPTYSSSFYSDGYKPSNAVNGDHNVDVYAGYCFSTNYDDMTPWLLIDLMSSYVIDNVTLTLRTDSIAARAHDYQLEVFEMNPVHCTSAVGQLCFKHDGQLGSSKTLTCDQEVKGRFLKLSKYVVNNREDTLDLCELDVAGTEANVQDDGCPLARYYPRTRGFELSQTTPSAPVTMSRLDCAVYCAMDHSCVGFNYRQESGTCHRIVRPTSDDTVQAVSSSDYYGFELC